MKHSSSSSPRVVSIVLVGLLLLAGIGGCSKDPTPPSVPRTPSKVHEWTDCLKDVQIVCGNMLGFVDQQHFDDVYDCLEQANDAWQDDFNTQWGYLDDEDFDDMADQLGFVDEQALMNFEGSFGAQYMSWRTRLANAEDAWLLNGADPATNPYLQDPCADEVMATLLNQNTNVMIGGVIIHYAANGDIVTISNGDCSLVPCILTDPPCPDPVIRVKSHLGVNHCGSEYGSDYGEASYYNQAPRRVVWFLKYQSVGGFTNGYQFRSEIRHYRWKNNQWKKKRTNLGVTQNGYLYVPDNNCDQHEINDPQSPRKCKSRHNSYVPTVYGDPAILDESIRSTFQYTGNVTVDHLDI